MTWLASYPQVQNAFCAISITHKSPGFDSRKMVHSRKGGTRCNQQFKKPGFQEIKARNLSSRSASVPRSAIPHQIVENDQAEHSMLGAQRAQPPHTSGGGNEPNSFGRCGGGSRPRLQAETTERCHTCRDTPTYGGKQGWRGNATRQRGEEGTGELDIKQRRGKQDGCMHLRWQGRPV